jgi:hypothetical protein
MNETTRQAAWIAYDRAHYAAGGGYKGNLAGMKARAVVLLGPAIEGPAENDISFSVRSTARLCGRLS